MDDLSIGDTSPVPRRDHAAKLVEGEPDEDLLVAFVYLLGRDCLPLGRIEAIFREHIDPMVLSAMRPRFSNPHLAAWAKDVAARLREPITEESETRRRLERARQEANARAVEAGRPPTAAEKAAMDSTP